jgi:hypothetical protein
MVRASQQRPGHGRAAALIAILAALALPATGHAACGGVVTARPASHPAGQVPPLAIGDSTMLLSLPGLAARGYDANAHGCRQFAEAYALLVGLRAAGRLPHMVTIALGANGDVTAGDIAATLRLLGPGGLLVLVTPRQLGGSAGPNAALEHSEARAHPRNILLLDWVRYSAAHPGWFQPDHLHLTLTGASAFTALLASALAYAYVPCPGS